jgi:hypothetical protein
MQLQPILPEVFTVSDVLLKFFTDHNLSIKEAVNLGRACKTTRDIIYRDVWKYFRERDGFTYTYKTYQGSENDKHIVHYRLSKFLTQYFETFSYSTDDPVLELLPIFKTFFNAIRTINNTGASSSAGCADDLKEEPILRAVIKIYLFTKTNFAGVIRFPHIPSEVWQTTSETMDCGATWLSKIALLLCKKDHTLQAVQSRFLPLLSKTAKKAAEKGDTSGQTMLAQYIKKYEGDIAENRRHKTKTNLGPIQNLLNAQLYRELSADEAALEDTLLQDLSNNPSIDILNTLLISYASLEKYEKANRILKFILQFNDGKISDRTVLLLGIKTAVHFDMIDVANNLHGQMRIPQRTCKVGMGIDISFLTEYARFKLKYSKSKKDLQVVDKHLSKYWKSGSWHKTIVSDFINSVFDISKVEDFKNPLFQDLIEAIIETKSKLEEKPHIIEWFKQVLAVIRIDINDKEACCALYKTWESNFDKWKCLEMDETLPPLLQLKSISVGLVAKAGETPLYHMSVSNPKKKKITGAKKIPSSNPTPLDISITKQPSPSLVFEDDTPVYASFYTKADFDVDCFFNKE